MVQQTAEKKARDRFRKALQEGRPIDARTPENQRILDEVKAELVQEASAGVKRVQDASYRGAKRIKQATENGVQEIRSATQNALAAVQAGTDSAQDAGADSSASGVQIEDVTDSAQDAEGDAGADSSAPVGKPVTLGPSGPAPVALYTAPRKKWTAKKRERELKLKEDKERYLEQQKAKEEEDRVYKERLDAARPEARKEVRARFPTCEGCEEADWNLGGACETHQEAIESIARGMVDREDAARETLLKAHDAGARGL